MIADASAGTQVDLSLVLGILSAATSGLLGLLLTLVKMNVDTKDKETDRRITEVRTKVDSVDSRLHIEEKATIRQDGEIRLVEQTHSSLSSDMQEIKQSMATKAEVNRIAGSVDKILERLEPVRRFTPGPGAYGASDPPKRGT